MGICIRQILCANVITNICHFCNVGGWACTYAHTCTIYLHTRMHACTHAHTRTHTRTRTHTHTHAQTHNTVSLILVRKFYITNTQAKVTVTIVTSLIGMTIMR